jgi:hypothetical protein
MVSYDSILGPLCEKRINHVNLSKGQLYVLIPTSDIAYQKGTYKTTRHIFT